MHFPGLGLAVRNTDRSAVEIDTVAAVRGRALGPVAVLVAQAGVDVLLFTGSETSSAAAFERLVSAAEQGSIPAVSLLTSYERIVRLKRTYG